MDCSSVSEQLVFSVPSRGVAELRLDPRGAQTPGRHLSWGSSAASVNDGGHAGDRDRDILILVALTQRVANLKLAGLFDALTVQALSTLQTPPSLFQVRHSSQAGPTAPGPVPSGWTRTQHQQAQCD